MYIDEHKFDIEKDKGWPLILKPREEFKIDEFIKTKREAILKFCELEPFFVIRGTEMNDGIPIGNSDDLINTHWHYDEGVVIVLANNFEENNRGKTEWVSDQVLIPAFLSQIAAIRNFDETAFSSTKMLEMFNELLDECQSGDRESISRILGVLYIAQDKPPALKKVLRNIEWKLGNYIMKCNWIEQSRSALFPNNSAGFHRVVYNVGQGQALKRKVV